MKNNLTILYIAVMTAFVSFSCTSPDSRTSAITFEPDTIRVLDNPLNGWVMYLARNWDENFWEEQGYDAMPADSGRLTVKVSDYASVAYLRTSWSAMEPEKGKYFWDDPDSRLSRLLESVRERGMKLAFRIVVDGRDQGANTPDFVFEDGAAYHRSLCP